MLVLRICLVFRAKLEIANVCLAALSSYQPQTAWLWCGVALVELLLWLTRVSSFSVNQDELLEGLTR